MHSDMGLTEMRFFKMFLFCILAAIKTALYNMSADSLYKLSSEGRNCSMKPLYLSLSLCSHSGAVVF